MYLKYLRIRNHPVLNDIDLDFINPKTNNPYSVIAFVGENGCGKTTLLNEVFNYEDSKYITDKEKEHPFSIAPYSALYLRQNSLAKNALRETRKLIDGKEIYPVNSTSHLINIGKMKSPLTEIKEGLSIIEKLDDLEIYKLFKEETVGEVHCSQEVSEVIDGKNHGQDISKYSSGQQEVLLKLKDLQELYTNTDSILLDEPETSLHPRWQREIIGIVTKLVTDCNNSKPQMFIATHSEKVLESLINKEDVQIVRLFKEKGKICYETIDQMKLCLPRTTFAELDYVIFKIDNYEYCSQLYDLLEWRFGNPYKVDKMLLKSSFYNESIHYKPWYNDKTDKTEQFALPTYVRNYFHHPKNREEPTQAELHNAIEFLVNVILHS